MSSLAESAAWATERKTPPSAAEFRFDPIVCTGPASRRTDVCSFSARRRGLVILVGCSA
jgi:hypothetical protein